MVVSARIELAYTLLGRPAYKAEALTAELRDSAFFN